MWNIEYLDEAGSTNDVARDARFGHGSVVATDTQTAGRGQKGNSWLSAPGENLTFSVVLTPTFLPVACQFLLSEAVSLAIADTLEQYGIDARIKWPNDIYADGRKIAGILIENDVKGSVMSRSIAGIGLNVNQTAFDPRIPAPASMKLAAGRAFDRQEVLAAFLDRLDGRYSALADGDSTEIEADYHRRLFRVNEPAIYSTPGGGRFTGTIRRVRQNGELIVEHTGGGMHSYLFKEIEFVL